MSKIKKLLESVKEIQEGMYDGGRCPDCGGLLDDEGWHAQECPARGGRRSRYRSNYRRPYTPPVSTNPDDKALRIATAIAKKKGLSAPDTGLINWVKTQIAAGKFAEATSLNNLLEETSKLLEKAKGKKFTQKGHDIAMHVKKSEKEAGKSPEEAEKIAWATATKQGERIKGK